MYRNLVVGCDSKVKLEDGRLVNYINFDNAATTPPFHSVLEGINCFAPNYSSVHRGAGYKSKLSSDLYEKGRDVVLDFVNGDRDYHTVIFLKNTTEGINKLSYRLEDQLKGKVVLSTYMEHHSNLLPWKYRYETDFVRVDDAGRLCLQDLEDKLKSYKGRVGLVAVTGASNVTGYTNDVHKIARLAHKYGAKILVDGAQLIPHCSFDMKPKEEDEHIDFLAFSAHKMYAPFGSGVLIAPKDIFKDGHSEIIGGGTIDFVSMEDTIWLNPPQKEEAGTPNLMGVVALMEAIKILESIGMERIEEYERNLTIYALNLMREIPNLIIYDDFNTDAKVSIISFNIEGMHHSKLAELLGKEGIGVRNGCFCAQPYVQQILKISDEEMEKYKDKLLPRPGLVRMSLGLYNSYEEVYRMAEVLDTIGRNVDYYLEGGR
ncbi:MAG: aminotransferase class V-fold PLP-dependent enzyme [Tissierellia bacterium]|nr:aminotransferase class V-fold PLP-dependent enzyme [Tissierellia bacterium]